MLRQPGHVNVFVDPSPKSWLAGRAIDPVEAGWKRNEPDRVVLFARIQREAIVKPGGLELIEQRGERGGVVGCVLVASCGEVEADAARQRPEPFAGVEE